MRTRSFAVASATADDLGEKARRGVAWTLLQNAGRHGGNFIVFLLLAKLLNPEVFGLVAMAGVFVVLVNVLIEQGLGEAIVQRSQLQPAHLDTAFWLNLALAALAVATTLIAAPWVAALYGQPGLAKVLQALSPLFLLTALTTVQQASLQRQFAFRALALRSLAATASGGVVGIGLAAAGFGVWSLVGQQLGAGLVSVIVLWRSSSWRPRARFCAAHARELWRFSRNVLGTNLLNFLSRKADDLLIGLFLGPAALGLYSVAYQIMTAVEQLLCQGLDAIALSGFSRLQAQLQAMRQAFLTAAQMAAVAVFPAFAGVALVAPELVGGVLGEQWLPSVPVIQWLAFAGLLHGVFHFNHAALKACGRPEISFRLMLVNTVANVALFLWVVRWGIEAVAAAYVVRAYLLGPLSLIAVRRLLDFRLADYLRQLVSPALATLVMAAALIAARPALPELDAGPRLVLLILQGVVVYTACLRILAPSLWKRVQSVRRSVAA